MFTKKTSLQPQLNCFRVTHCSNRRWTLRVLSKLTWNVFPQNIYPSSFPPFISFLPPYLLPSLRLRDPRQRQRTSSPLDKDKRSAICICFVHKNIEVMLSLLLSVAWCLSFCFLLSYARTKTSVDYWLLFFPVRLWFKIVLYSIIFGFTCENFSFIHHQLEQKTLSLRDFLPLHSQRSDVTFQIAPSGFLSLTCFCAVGNLKNSQCHQFDKRKQGWLSHHLFAPPVDGALLQRWAWFLFPLCSIVCIWDLFEMQTCAEACLRLPFVCHAWLTDNMSGKNGYLSYQFQWIYCWEDD